MVIFGYVIEPLRTYGGVMKMAYKTGYALGYQDAVSDLSPTDAEMALWAPVENGTQKRHSGPYHPTAVLNGVDGSACIPETFRGNVPEACVSGPVPEGGH